MRVQHDVHSVQLMFDSASHLNACIWHVGSEPAQFHVVSMTGRACLNAIAWAPKLEKGNRDETPSCACFRWNSSWLLRLLLSPAQEMRMVNSNHTLAGLTV